MEEEKPKPEAVDVTAKMTTSRENIIVNTKEKLRKEAKKDNYVEKSEDGGSHVMNEAQQFWCLLLRRC